MTELFSTEWWSELLTTEEEWENIHCQKCDIKMDFDHENEYNSVKICPKCKEKIILVKKLKKDGDIE